MLGYKQVLDAVQARQNVVLLTNRTIQNLFEFDVQRASSVLADLVDRGVLVKVSTQS